MINHSCHQKHTKITKTKLYKYLLATSLLIPTAPVFAVSLPLTGGGLISGTDCGIASYRFTTAAQYTTADTVVHDLDLLVNVLDEDNDKTATCITRAGELFQVDIDDADAGDDVASMDFQFTVVDRITGSPVEVDRILITGFDLDSNGDGQTETDDVYLEAPDGAYISSGSNVLFSEGPFGGVPANYTVKLKGQASGNCNDSSASPEIFCRGGGVWTVGTNVNSVSSIVVRVQNDNAYGQNTNPAAIRRFQLSFKVEDLDILVGSSHDYGDAPNSYGSAVHDVTLLTTLGSGVPADDELAQQGSADATGDDTDTGSGNYDDEDSVTISGQPLQGQSLAPGASYDFDIQTFGAGYLTAWIDFDGNGDFSGANEQVIVDQQVTGTGVNTTTLSVSIPLTATGVTDNAGKTFVRVRFSAASGTAPTGNGGDGEVEDYMIVIPSTAVTGHLYIDSNGNNTQDAGETDLANVDVLVTDANNDTQTVTTDSDGNWTASVPAGSVTADIDNTDPDIPVGAVQTEGTDPTTVTAILGESTPTDNDGFKPGGVIAGTVYEDSNGNNRQDPGEPGISNVSIEITDVNSSSQTLITDENGNYAATVPAGDTVVDIDESTLPSGFIQTEGSDPTTINVPSSGIGSDIDGYKPAADAGTINGVVYQDNNGNGSQDAGEPGIAGVTVTITDSEGGTQILTTDANGGYNATVPAGDTTVDIDETTLPGGSTQTEGTDTTTLTVPTGGTASDVDGYQPAVDAGTLTGTVYEDTDGNGAQGGNEPGLPGVQVNITDSTGNVQTVTTDENGNYNVTVPAGATLIDIDETTLPGGSTQTEGTDTTTVTIPAGGSASDIDGYQPSANQGTLSGVVYEDTDGNGTQAAGEPGIAGVDVTITDSAGGIQTVVTDSEGAYSASVPAGDTLVDIDQHDIDPNFTLSEGTDPTTVTVPAGGAGTDIDGFKPGGIVAGTVYQDSNGNNTQDPGEPGIPNVSVQVTDVNGQVQTLTTDSNGNYATTVPTGDTIVDIGESTLPTGFTQTEGTDPTTLTVPPSGIGSDVDGYQPPADAGTVNGIIYQDSNGNSTQNIDEPGIPGVQVEITDNAGNVQIVTTDARGEYSATVPAGSTQLNVDETTLPGGSTQTEGTDTTTVTVPAGGSATDVDGYQPAADAGTVSGVVYTDTDGDGSQNNGEPGIPGVQIEITDSAGNVQTVTTDINGEYSATVPPGSTQLNVDETTLPGGSTQTEGTDITTVTVPDGGTATDKDGYQPPADQGTLTGVVYEDTDGNGSQAAGEPGIAGVDVTITDSEGGIQTVVTDSQGAYSASVPAGATLVDIDQNDLDPTFSLSEGTDPTTVIVPAGGTGTDVDGFTPAPKGVVAGTIYQDSNGNGIQDPGEPGIPNVSVSITDVFGATQTLITDDNGNYAATISAGDTVVNIDETTLPTDFIQTQGTDTTTITVPVNGIGSDVDGYQPPADAGTINGVVYEDSNGNGTQDANEPGIAGVTVTITDSKTGTQLLTTDANGVYSATVPAGDTTVDIDETTLPGGSTQTQGTDSTTITVPAGGTVSDVDGYQPAEDAGILTGTVYADTDGDGAQGANEPGLPGVQVEITDSAGNVQTVTTDANGQYRVTVPAGDTRVDIDETTLPGGSTQTEGTDTTVITVPAGGTANDTDGYQPSAEQGTLSGVVYEDSDGNGTQDAGEPGIPGVEVTITDREGGIQTVVTDNNGAYSTSVPAGDTLVDIDQNDIDPNFILTEGNDPTTVAVPAGGTGTDVDGFKPGGVVAGTVYQDSNGNSTQDPGEPGIANVEVTVTDVNGVVQILTTDSNGNYAATVPTGDAIVDIEAATLPTGFTATEGSDPTTVSVPPSGIGSDVDGFKPPVDAGTVTGIIYQDSNGDGTQNIDEPGMPGVQIEITDSAGNVQTVTTDANGNYSATVPAGSTQLNVDETTIPGGSTQTEGTDTTTVIVPAGGTASDVDGYQPPANAGEVSGTIYQDTNGNGTQDLDEPGIPGVQIDITDVDGNTQTVTTDDSGVYIATVPAGETTLDVDETTLPGGSTQTEGTDITTVTVPAAGSATDTDGYQPSANQGTLTGIVYEDTDDSGSQDVGEPGIAGVDVTITDSDGGIQTVVTDSNGAYSASVPAGGTLVDIDQNDIDPTFGLSEGTDPTTVNVPVGGTGSDIDGFTPAPKGVVAGTVYEDSNGNGIQDPGEPGIPNISVIITDVFGATQTLTTDENGNYAASIPAGDTLVDIDETTLPTDFIQTQGTDTTTITVPINGIGSDVDGYKPPADAGTVNGVVYEDSNGNGSQDTDEPGIAGITVTITDSKGGTQILTTDANGMYNATVPAGDTTVDIDETTLPGGSTQTEGTDTTIVTVPAGGIASDVDGYQPVEDAGTIGGVIYEDSNGDGTQNNGEPGIPGVRIEITDSAGNMQTVTTDENGNYSATVPPGSTQLNVDETTLPGGSTQTEGSDITTLTVPVGGSITDTDGYQPPATQGTLSGIVYEDTDGNGTQDADEPGIAGVDVTITDSEGGIQTVITDSNGEYSVSVPAGDTLVDIDQNDIDPTFTLSEGTDPTTVDVPEGGIGTDVDGFTPAPKGVVAGTIYEDSNSNGTQDPGEPGIPNVSVSITDRFGATQTVTTDDNGNYAASIPAGETIVNIDETTLPTDFIQTQGTDTTTITVPINGIGNDVDGYKPPADAGVLTGTVYEDSNGNGQQDANESGIEGVTITIIDSKGGTQILTTDVNGHYSVTVPAGETTVDVDETTLPGGSTQTDGTDSTTLTVPAGGSVSDVDGYQPPAGAGTITGVIYQDSNGDGTQDGDELGMPGVQIEITDVNGNTQTVTTDENGHYRATVPAGAAELNVDETTLPGGSTQTEGSDITTVTVPTNGTVTDTDGYQPPIDQGNLTGIVYEDSNGNGIQDASEPGITGVDVTITDSAGSLQTVITDSNGAYRVSVPAGNTLVDINQNDIDSSFTLTEGTDPTLVNVPVAGIGTDVDGFKPGGVAAGTVYEDRNDNGRQDPGEPGIPNVSIEITDVQGIVHRVITDENGNYAAVVPEGNTVIDIVDATLPTDFTQTEGNDPTTINVPSGGIGSDVDGFKPSADAGTVTGTVYEDSNGNGVQDEGEPGIEGVTVTITDNKGGMQTLTTDVEGNYSATVPAGETIVDIDETTLPGDSTQTEGTDTTTLTVPAGESVSDVDGYQPPADAGTIGGVIYEDSNGNGTQDPGEPGMPGVQIEITDVNGNTQTVTTDENGNYSVTVPAGATELNVDETTLPGGSTQTEGTDVTTIIVPDNGTVTDTDGYQPPANQGSLTGIVYEDTNGNGTQEGDEPGIAGVDVTITDSVGGMQTVVTDSEGAYSASVPAGATLVDIDQDDINPTFALSEGTDPTTVIVPTGSTGTDIDGFTPAPKGVVAGTIYQDSNGNGTQDPGEPGIPNVSVTITDVFGATQTLSTDDNGNYAVALPAGKTIVDIDETTLPTDFIQTQGTDTTTLIVPVKGIGSDVDGYKPPADAGTLTGTVYEDSNGNGVQDADEPGIEGVTVTITDSKGATQTLTTDVNGEYTVTVPAGETTVAIDETTLPAGSTQTEGTHSTTVTVLTGETTTDTDGYQPPADAGEVSGIVYEDSNGNGSQDPGELGMPGVQIEITDIAGNIQTVTTDQLGAYSATVPAGATTLNVDKTTIPGGSSQTEGTDVTTVTVPSGGAATDTDGYAPPANQGTLSGIVYEDSNGNGSQDAGEPGIAGVDVTITDSAGSIQTVVTDSNGLYSASVPAGDTLVDIDQNDIDPAFTLSEGTDPTAIQVPAGGTGTDVDGFKPGGIAAGTVYEDSNGNGTQDPGEPGMPNVNVVITDVNGRQHTVTTDENGNYAATVPESTTIIDIDESTLPGGFSQTEGTDPTVVTVPSGGIGSDVDGYQPPADSATVNGVVYQDTDGNGSQDKSEPDDTPTFDFQRPLQALNGQNSAEPGYPGVTVIVTDSLGGTQILTTDAEGKYSATVPAGLTTLNIKETTLPGGSTQTEGANPTTVNVPAGGSASDVDGYVPPADASIVTGIIYEDSNANGTQDAGEPGISGVQIEVTDVNGNTQTVTTDNSGVYAATVPAGETTLDVDETTLPGNSTQTEGTDVTTVTALSGDTVTDTDGYAPPGNQGNLTGIVYLDSNGNGAQDAGEPGLSDVDVTITDSEGGIQTVITGNDGSYAVKVPAGNTLVDIDQNDIDPSYTLTEGTDPTLVAVPAGGTGIDVDGYQPPAPGTIRIAKTGYGGHDNGLGCGTDRAVNQIILVDIDKSRDEQVTYCFEITNPGTNYLSDIQVSDTTLGVQHSQLSLLNGPAPVALAAKQTLTYYYEMTASESVVNTATVTARLADVNGNPIGGVTSSNDTTSAELILIIDPPSANKTVTAEGDIAMQWQMVWINDSTVAAPGVVVYDEVPVGTHFQAMTAGQFVSSDGVYCEARGQSVTQSCFYEGPSNSYPRGRVVWEGVVASDPGLHTEEDASNEVVIRFVSVLDNPTQQQAIENQAISEWDFDGNGTPEIFVPTDDPVTRDGDVDATVFTPRVTPPTPTPTPTSPQPIPTLSEWMMLMLSGMMGLLGWGSQRRRGGQIK